MSKDYDKILVYSGTDRSRVHIIEELLVLCWYMMLHGMLHLRMWRDGSGSWEITRITKLLWWLLGTKQTCTICEQFPWKMLKLLQNRKELFSWKPLPLTPPTLKMPSQNCSHRSTMLWAPRPLKSVTIQPHYQKDGP